MPVDATHGRRKLGLRPAGVVPRIGEAADLFAGNTQAAATAVIGAGAVVAYVLAIFLAEPLRDSLMIETPRAPKKPTVAAGARAESDRFLATRDTIVLRVPRAMEVGEFLDLYHLRNTRGIREALQRQAGVRDDDAILPAHKELRLHLTVPYR